MHQIFFNLVVFTAVAALINYVVVYSNKQFNDNNEEVYDSWVRIRKIVIIIGLVVFGISQYASVTSTMSKREIVKDKAVTEQPTMEFDENPDVKLKVIKTQDEVEAESTKKNAEENQATKDRFNDL